MQKIPKWLELADECFNPIHQRIAIAVQDNDLPTNQSFIPREAAWFFVQSLGTADDANRKGRHALSLSLTRNCIETLSLIEIGISRHVDRGEILKRWQEGESPGKLRMWLEKNRWAEYGPGLWNETWADFAGQLARAIQPYAHYSYQLAQWQSKLVHMDSTNLTGVIETGPEIYDPQKASRITLLHCILNYSLGRVFLANTSGGDGKFKSKLTEFGSALSKSKYLDGHQTDWNQQFWAMMWNKRAGSPLME